MSRRCRALTALDRSEDRRSALSIRALRSAHRPQERRDTPPAADRGRSEPNKLRSPGSRPTYTETATRCTYATRGSAVMSRDTGCPDKVAELSTGAVSAGTRSKLGSKLTIQIRIQTHAQIRADAVHQGTLRTRVARAHKSGDAFRLWPV